jgi:hypothetical protein
MTSVPQTPTPRKAPRAFYAQFMGLSGALTRPADFVLFLEPESGAVVTITPADEPHLVVLGEVETAMAQYLDDMARGGAARIACDRRQEMA